MAKTVTTGSTFKVEPVKRTGSLGTHVASQLEQMITQGKIPVGEKLPTEGKLCDMFEVSRTVVREAITQLKSLGLVETRRGVGTTVLRNQPAETLFAYTINPTAVEDILNILELRLSVETQAAEFAAVRRDDRDLEQLEQCLDRFDQALEKGELARDEDLAFHLGIASATKNPFFRQFYEQFNKNIIPRAKIVNTSLDHPATEQYLDRVRQEHREIFEAIKSRQPEAARKAMHTHLYRAYHLYEKYRTNKAFE
ncbi:FadR family transcriptional regulator [Marinobacter halodurans]|uniref:FadR family transcriptional regulator n=1 Tax=Marinobacter halodurans TaxID=2528979 RepID=A0ABY1ZLW0_9GAMM|nr:FadR/GntR family transcriptional regulator [Marinobacter halodurans]TBW55701.1 FadR family transcriptional regulator [Marinobacter halodurans]